MKSSSTRNPTRSLHVQAAIRDCLIGIPLGVLIGSACAAFLWSLDVVTRFRLEVPRMLYLLPIAGVGLGWVYTHFGKPTNAGNNLVITAIRSADTVPRRMAPLIVLSTLVTHLFGGSAGREGTAVQMGAGVASFACGFFKLTDLSKQTLLLSGVAAGFGGVFGTPVAGAVFGLEMIANSRPSLWTLLPSAIAAFVSDHTCRQWGIIHTVYPIDRPLTDLLFGRLSRPDLLLFGKIVLAAVVFGLAARAFAQASHASRKVLEKHIPSPYKRPFVGGLIVVALAGILGHDSLGLGTFSNDPHALTIASFFTGDHRPWWSWLWKAGFTICTLSSGFKGGEVTPLFFVGASLGHTASEILFAPGDLFAALGLASVFAAASHTPLACAILGCELFGSEFALYFITSCFVANWACGRPTIYSAQSDSP